MVKVLVTGATGFIGSRLVERLLADGDEVTCLVRGSSKTDHLQKLGVRLAVGDVRDADAVRRAVESVDVVYHLAGMTAAFKAADMEQVNGAAVRNVAEGCARRETPCTMIYVSSLAAAGPSTADRPRIESDPPVPVSCYGRAKRTGELIAEEYAARVPITIVRPPIVFGQGEMQMLDLFRIIHRTGFHLALGVGQSHFSLIHVQDLIDAMKLCVANGRRLSRERSGANGDGRANEGYYFVAYHEQPTFEELGLWIGKSLGRTKTRMLRTSSTKALWAAALLTEIGARLRRRPHIFNFDKAREAVAGHWTCSAERIRQDLGYAPSISVTERLRETADWYREHKLL